MISLESLAKIFTKLQLYSALHTRDLIQKSPNIDRTVTLNRKNISFTRINDVKTIKSIWENYIKYRPDLITILLLGPPQLLLQFVNENPDTTISLEQLAIIFSNLKLYDLLNIFEWFEDISEFE